MGCVAAKVQFSTPRSVLADKNSCSHGSTRPFAPASSNKPNGRQHSSLRFYLRLWGEAVDNLARVSAPCEISKNGPQFLSSAMPRAGGSAQKPYHQQNYDTAQNRRNPGLRLGNDGGALHMIIFGCDLIRIVTIQQFREAGRLGAR